MTLLFSNPPPIAGETVDGISLHEPWASLMKTGSKTIETRSWRPPDKLIGKWFLICAAKRRVWAELAVRLGDEDFQEGLGNGPHPLRLGSARLIGDTVTSDDLWFGHAVALVRLLYARRTDILLRQPHSMYPEERVFGDFAPGRFGWVTGELHLFKPFPVKGKQGLFRVELPADFVAREA